MSEVTPAAQATPTAAPKETPVVPATAEPKVEPKVEPTVEPKIDPKPDSKIEPDLKVAEEKPAEKPADPPKPPEKYELKPRKDSPLLKSDVEEIEAAAKANGLSQEQAQKLVESREVDHDKFAVRQQEAYRDKMAEWKKAAESDKEISGSDGKMFKENVELAHRGLARVADAEVMKFISESGWGNNPGAIKMFMRIGKLFADDKAVLDGKSAPPGKRASTESKLYPTHNKKE